MIGGREQWIKISRALMSGYPPLGSKKDVGKRHRVRWFQCQDNRGSELIKTDWADWTAEYRRLSMTRFYEFPGPTFHLTAEEGKCNGRLI